MHCIVCNRGIKHTDSEGRLLCQEHSRSLTKLEIDDRKRKRKFSDAWKWVSYRGHVVKLQIVKGKVRPSYLGMSTNRVPKGKLLNLDTFIPSLDRKTVKRLKRLVLSVS